MSWAGNSIRHIDHFFANADCIAGSAHANPEVEKDARSDHSDDRSSQDSASPRGQYDVSRADAFSCPYQRKANQHHNCLPVGGKETFFLIFNSQMITRFIHPFIMLITNHLINKTSFLPQEKKSHRKFLF